MKLGAWLLASLMAALLFVARPVRADEARPNDAPLVAQDGDVKLPPLPGDYETRSTAWLRISYPTSIRDRIDELLEQTNLWKANLERDFNVPVLDAPVEVRVGRIWDDLPKLAPVGVGVPAYASGVTYTSLRVVLLSLTEPHGGEATDLATVFHHELVHVAVEDATQGRHVPRWFNEGLAIYESGEHPIGRLKTLWDATLSRTVLPLTELDRGFPDGPYEVNVAYAESADVVRFLLRGADHVRFGRLFERLRAREPFDRALSDAYGTDVRTLEFQWREECAKRYTFGPMLASGSFVWVLTFGALVVGYRRRRREHKETLARWEREEKAEDEAAARLAESGPDVTRLPQGLPKIEHDGGWHTLH